MSDETIRELRTGGASAVRPAGAFEVARGLTAGAVLISGYIHLDLWFQGFRQVATIGPLFLLNAIGGLVIAVAIFGWRHWLPVLAAVGFGALTLVTFWLSITAGLFGLHETASGVPQVTAEIAEIIAVGCGLIALAPDRHRVLAVPAGAVQRLRGR